MHLKSPGASQGLLSDILEIFLRRLWNYFRAAVPPVFEGLVIFILGLAVGVCERPTFKAFWSEPLDFIQESVESVFGRRRTMRPSRFSEEQIIAILKEQEAGAKTAEVCRRHGISDASFYKWKAKYGGLDVSEAKRLKVLEDENAKLKKLLAEAMLDNAMLKDIAAKKW